MIELKAEAVSPNGLYLNSSILSLHIVAVLETEMPFDDSQAALLIKSVFLPINPRFSSIMVTGPNGEKQWKGVEVNLRKHIHTPIFPGGESPEFYDECLADYLSELSAEELPSSQPLWEIHIVKYPTVTAAGSIVFKLHHALGDGYSLMGALLSCLERADDPSLPLTFPALCSLDAKDNSVAGCIDVLMNGAVLGVKRAGKVFSAACNKMSDFCFSLIMSTLVEDDVSPLRSGSSQVATEFRPVSIAGTAFSLDQIREIKSRIGATINDVITGVIFLGARLYMEEMEAGSGDASATALVLLNTRMVGGYTSIQEMAKPDRNSTWGNRFAFLHVPIPKLQGNQDQDPLQFIRKARRIILKRRNSLAVYLTGKTLDLIRKTRGPEAAAGYVSRTIRSASLVISNVIGPMEKVSVAKQPVKGMYFFVTGKPQSLGASVVSYMGNLRVTVGAEKGIVDTNKLISCIETAFEIILHSSPT
ncbi:unnamed protein product [Linum tenue]|uniref:Diacylglycerol O-acyltransferase n=1 Tax=Linum tenue TaxID=586396 RepID=A0AAV0QWZ7_9ROSI|nr:unnamed protein product [Linum tenue]